MPLPVKKHHITGQGVGDAQYKEMQMKVIEIFRRNCKYDLCQKSISEPCQHHKRLRPLCSHIACANTWLPEVGRRHMSKKKNNQYLAVLITMIGHSCQGHGYAEAHR